MDWLKNRPLLFWSMLFLISSFAAFYMIGFLKLVGIVILVVGIVLLFVLRRCVYIPALLFTLLGLLVSYVYFDVYYASMASLIGKSGEVEAVVLKNNYSTNYSAGYDIQVKSINGKRLSTKMKLDTTYPAVLVPFQRFVLPMRFEDFEQNSNGFPEKTYALSKGFTLQATSEEEESLQILKEREHSSSYFFYTIHEACTNFLEFHFPKRNSGFLIALFLGNGDALPDDVQRDFQRLGISHMLAISGMHFVILLGGIEFALKLLLVGKNIRNLTLILLSIGFMGITGFSPAITRAGIMMILYYTSFLVGRDPDSMTALFLSGMLICFFRPFAIGDISFLLSFSATLCVIWIGKQLTLFSERKKHLPFLLKNILFTSITTFTVTIGTLPLVWVYFGQCSILSIPANLLFSPMIDFLLCLAPYLFLFCKIPFLFPILQKLAIFLTDCILSLSKWMAQCPNAMLSLNYDFVKYCLGILVIGIVLLLLLKVKKQLYFLLPVGVCIMVYAVCFGCYQVNQNAYTSVTYLQDKKNDGFVVSSGNKALLCDISDGSYSISAKGNFVITESAFTEIDTYLLTHYHRRHIVTFQKIASKTYIRNVYLPKPMNQADWLIFQSIYEIALDKGCHIYYYDRSKMTQIQYGKATITLPPYTKMSRSTHPVLALNIATPYANVAYIGGSALESPLADFCNQITANSWVICFGIHGPIIKKEMMLSTLSASLRCVLYANEAVFSNMKREFTESIYFGRSTIPQMYVQGSQTILLPN